MSALSACPRPLTPVAPESNQDPGESVAANPTQKDWTSSGNHLGIPANIFTPGDPKADWYVEYAAPPLPLSLSQSECM